MNAFDEFSLILNNVKNYVAELITVLPNMVDRIFHITNHDARETAGNLCN